MQLNCITRKSKIIVVRASCPRPIYKLNTQQLSLFWDADEVVRFGITENLYGGDEIRNFRQNRSNPKIEREISNLKVVTFGKDAATVTLEFRQIINGVERFGRQSQTWYRFTEGWKVVAAHVSLLPV